jgi:type IV pilus biogenesis protein CpaD/CtpE
VREIDPIRNPSEALLSAALHRLATGSAQNAPADVGARLAQEFRRHHLRRRRARTALVVSLVASLALAAALLLSLKPVKQNAPTVAHEPAQVVVPSPGTGTQNATAQAQASQTGHKAAQSTASRTSVNEFVALDTYDPALAPSEFQIVRLELTGADLRLVGAPVTEDLSDRRLLADIVVGNDGTPYAVRLIR